MLSTRKPTALIIGRDASLGRALADWLVLSGIDVTFADLGPGVTLKPDPDFKTQLAALVEQAPNAPSKTETIFDQVFCLIDPTSGDVTGPATAEEASDMQLRAMQQALAHVLARRPYQQVTIRRHVASPPKGGPPSDTAVDTELLRLKDSLRSASRRAAAELRGMQSFLASVAIDPATDLRAAPTYYDRAVANLLGRALAAFATVRETASFRFLPISLRPDGDPLAGAAED